MANSQKNKGDRAEREAAFQVTLMTGHSCRRKLGAGRQDDQGDLDIDGWSHTVVQVADWKDISRAVRVKPPECEQQQRNAAAAYGFTMIRLRGGQWRIVMTTEQMAQYLRLVP